MTHHPKERNGSLNRRDFLLRSAAAATVLSTSGGLLAACSSETVPEATTSASGEPLGPGGLPLARPDKRVELPLWEDPIESGLEPETGGTFTVFNYPAYLYRKLLNEFGEKYGVEVKVRPLRQHQFGDRAPRLGCRPARRDGDDAGQPGSRRSLGS